MSSIFTKIIQGDIPCYKIAECDHAMAFLDIRPLSKGHTLVVPKMEVDRLFDLPEDEFLALWAFAHKVAKAIDVTIPCNRVGVAVLGFEVPHAHIHLVPLRTEEELNFAHPKLQLAPEVMEEIAALIAHEVSEDILH
jgi:histidine triad (HIT) family protein